jgi:hypothetical protein
MAAEGQYVSGYGRVLFAGAGAFGPSHRAVEKLKEPSRDRLLKVVFSVIDTTASEALRVILSTDVGRGSSRGRR